MARARWLALGWILAGCGSWPRWSALEDPSVPADRAVAADWSPVGAEAEPNDTVAGSLDLALDVGAAVLLEGTLDGTGWCAEAEHPDTCAPEADPGCGTPFGWTGRYAGDLELVALEVAGDGPLHLCARGRVDGAALFDLLLYPWPDSCPTEPQLDGDEPLGWSLSPNGDGWGADVSPGRYLLVLGGSLPLDGASPDDPAAWTLGLALVGGDPDGGIVRCPTLPGETGGDGTGGATP